MNLLLCYLSVVSGVQGTRWLGPSPTAHIPTELGASSNVAPAPTPQHLRQVHDVLKRDINSNICGWIDGNYDSAFSCNDPKVTCLWNSKSHLVGCGNTEIMPYITSCIDFANLDYCDTACQSDVAINKCSASAPFCYTADFGNQYSMFPCGASSSMSMNVALTYTGQGTPLNLPRYLGDDGVVTLGTQLPQGVSDSDDSYTTSSKSPPAISSSSTSRPSPYLSGSSSSAPFSATSSAQESSHPSSKSNIGPIVGGVVGGVVVMALLGIGLGLFLRRRNKKLQPANEQESSPAPWTKHELPVPDERPGAQSFPLLGKPFYQTTKPSTQELPAWNETQHPPVLYNTSIVRSRIHELSGQQR